MTELAEAREMFIESIQKALHEIRAPREVVKERQKVFLGEELFLFIDGFLEYCKLGKKDIAEVLERVRWRLEDML